MAMIYANKQNEMKWKKN